MGLLFNVVISRDDLRELCGRAGQAFEERDDEKLKQSLVRIADLLESLRQFTMLEPSSRHNRN
jgi:hypothetical protein